MKSRVVVITGVSRGLGRAMAAGFAAAGHIVVGCGTNAGHVDSLARELGREHDVRVVDVASDDVGAWARDVVERHGPPDLLINNAGVMNEVRPLWEVPQEEFEHLMAVNVVGVYRVLRAFLPSMIAAGGGVVVNFSSGWGRSTSPGVAPYCASKFAIEGMTRALAQELPTGLAAIALSPGVVDTDMLRTAWAEGAAAHRKPDAWARDAVPYLLGLGAAENGESLTI